jgi:phosphoribosylformylglycinamidine synthase
MKPLILKGSAVFTEFRADALLKALKDALACAGDLTVDSSYVYLLETAGVPDAVTLERACTLLDAAEFAGFSSGFYVTPRKGTISPWSSKATDIFRNCGLDASPRRARHPLSIVSTPADARCRFGAAPAASCCTTA